MKVNKHLTLGLILAVTLFACTRTVEELPNLDTTYYPLETGKYRIYAIDSVVYNDFEERVDTNTYFLKEEIGETETDNLGKIYYRINRYTRVDTVGAPWIFDAVWAAQVVDHYAYSIENNQRYLNLVFPIKLDKDWDGLVYIRRDTTISIPGGSIDVYKDWGNFKIIGLDETSIIDGISYDSVVTILRADKVNNIERRYSMEKYAKNIGLILRRDSILDTQCGGNITVQCIQASWAEKAEKGFILNQRLIETNW